MPQLGPAQYGKENIRVLKVDKNGDGTQNVTEMTVSVMLEGEIDVSYTEADNSVVVPTDTMKQTTYIMAKQHPVNPPELFASILASHFVQTYSHIQQARVNVLQHRWSRMTVDEKPHPHSFLRDSDEKRKVEAIAHKKHGIMIYSSVKGLLVLKSTGSAFHGFVQDEYTILKPTTDRILSTEVDCGWAWAPFTTPEEVEASKAEFDKTWAAVREITLSTFAKDESASVQNTMYKMGEQILAIQPKVNAADYKLPNKHYFEIDLSWHKGLKNTGKDAEVYAPQSDPNGLIHCSVLRDGFANKE